MTLFANQYTDSTVDDFYEHTKNYRLFQPGAQYPPIDDVERIAKYRRGRAIFNGKQYEIYQRASEILKDTPHAAQIEKLYIAVNLIDILLTKPADLMVGEPPQYESGKPDDSREQKALNRIVENNDLNKQIHESVVGNGYRGDAWFKTRYGYYEDFSELPAGALIPTDAEMGPIIEHIRADYVFPETSRGNVKKYKAVNIAWVEWVEGETEEVPFLNVERHLPGFIVYERFALHAPEVDGSWGVSLQLFRIGESVPTGREHDIVETGVPYLLVDHAPYKAVDDDWRGISGIEKIESMLAAINDRLVQIDYILWKHSDPTLYGPDLEGASNASVRFGGRYIPLSKEDATPGAITWNGQLDYAFKELDMLIGMVFQMSETPQWLFGTTLAGDNSGGTGTSHTDGQAIESRFMPILKKVERIRVYYDRMLRDALWKAQMLENAANRGQGGFERYTPIYPTINWRDGLPRDEKTQAETLQLNTGGKPVIDQLTAIKQANDVDDMQAREILDRIQADEERALGTVDSSVFNAQPQSKAQTKVNGNGTSV